MRFVAKSESGPDTFVNKEERGLRTWGRACRFDPSPLRAEWQVPNCDGRSN